MSDLEETREVEVHLDLKGRPHRVGLLRRHSSRQPADTLTFEYDRDWLASEASFELDQGLPLTPGLFEATRRRRLTGALSDAAPDTWGRQLMGRAEQRRARNEGRRVRSLHELDYLLGVTDEVRTGALRFRPSGGTRFRAHTATGVPTVVALRRLQGSVDRLEEGDESDEDLELILAPGSSLGGARPKAAIIDQEGRLAIAKFPRPTDDYSLETWEAIALQLAERAGIATPHHELVRFGDRPILLSRRFDREGTDRIPFLSAMSLTGSVDGESGSYPEIVDEITRQGARAKADSMALYRRVAFNVLISNVDDHLRNHGFLWLDRAGWSLSPVYDLNPTPVDVRARVLTTRIDLDDATCSLELVLSACEYFGLSLSGARSIVRSVGEAVQQWRTVAEETGASPRETDRMASAFEHDDLRRAVSLRRPFAPPARARGRRAAKEAPDANGRPLRTGRRTASD